MSFLDWVVTLAIIAIIFFLSSFICLGLVFRAAQEIWRLVAYLLGDNPPKIGQRIESPNTKLLGMRLFPKETWIFRTGYAASGEPVYSPFGRQPRKPGRPRGFDRKHKKIFGSKDSPKFQHFLDTAEASINNQSGGLEDFCERNEVPRSTVQEWLKERREQRKN